MPDSPLVLICGDESFLIDRSARAWRERAASAELAVEIFDQPTKLAALTMSLAEMPLFDPERVVVIRNPPQLSGQTKRGADAAEGLVAALEGRAPTTAVCIVNHGPVAAGNPVRAAVQTLGGEIIEHPRVKGRDLRTFAETAARERGLRLESRSLDHIVATVGPDLGSLSAELDKLLAFADGTGITHDDLVILICGDPQVETWNVIEWLLGPVPGRGAAAVDALLAEGRPPQLLLITLAGQVRELIAARALLSESRLDAAGVAAAMRLPSWRADRLVRQARQVPGKVSVAWLRELQRVDAATKAGDADDAESLRGFARAAAAAVVAMRP